MYERLRWSWTGEVSERCGGCCGSPQLRLSDEYHHPDSHSRSDLCSQRNAASMPHSRAMMQSNARDSRHDTRRLRANLFADRMSSSHMPVRSALGEFDLSRHSDRSGGVRCSPTSSTNRIPFETMSKRRRGYPSETQVKRGVRIVHGHKLLEEKLGRNDLCPCGSGQRFKKCCLSRGCF